MISEYAVKSTVKAGVRTTRCFMVTTSLNGKKVWRWIFACNAEMRLMSAFEIMRTSKVLEQSGVIFDLDFAPKSQELKVLESFIYNRKK